jgi:hypothetical protein
MVKSLAFDGGGSDADPLRRVARGGPAGRVIAVAPGSRTAPSTLHTEPASLHVLPHAGQTFTG